MADQKKNLWMADQKKSLWERLQERLFGKKVEGKAETSTSPEIKNIEKPNNISNDEKEREFEKEIAYQFETEEGYTVKILVLADKAMAEKLSTEEKAKNSFRFPGRVSKDYPGATETLHQKYLSERYDSCRYNKSCYIGGHYYRDEQYAPEVGFDKKNPRLYPYNDLRDGHYYANLIKAFSKTSTYLGIPTQYTLHRDMNSQTLQLVKDLGNGNKDIVEYKESEGKNGYIAINDYINNVKNSLGLKYKGAEREYYIARAKAEALEVLADAYVPAVWRHMSRSDIFYDSFNKEYDKRMIDIKHDYNNWCAAKKFAEDNKIDFNLSNETYEDYLKTIDEFLARPISEIPSDEEIQKYQGILDELDYAVHPGTGIFNMSKEAASNAVSWLTKADIEKQNAEKEKRKAAIIEQFREAAKSLKEEQSVIPAKESIVVNKVAITTEPDTKSENKVVTPAKQKTARTRED